MHPLVGPLLLVERPTAVERVDLDGRKRVRLKVRALAERVRSVME